ncbi:hypothetical protein A3D71_03860 [Candidatus Kaiserbacteria bacterium RIFCSPHIGHO2_02_FULL_55_20]|uniref:Uncharacterized protein n=1 Tax=Candidatus Kaiserbacteria bacterium RIFCSPHIGHO2_02_FULL_55_20 TaxID=1798497 RepID=A0A1F6DWE0_9BACT|nr:MAG: hypothetical protein A2680_02380 [Candidatus Kaiserbacteria bacterium RIFCSPHIGHO2_01_FULL_55_37]OGG65741.1 MAG: hypothetical protein A3D71_03860 [Candidatus Kaiserbacteria bacterium RIFCSPHIGHO2_02_FULL_55_20]
MRISNSYKVKKTLSKEDIEKREKEIKTHAEEVTDEAHASSIERKKGRDVLQPWDHDFLKKQAEKKTGGPKPPIEGVAGRIFDGKPFDATKEVTWTDVSRCSQVLVKIERDALEESASRPLLLARGPIAMNLKILTGEPVATCNEALHQEMLAARDVLRGRLMGTETPEAAAQDFLKAEAEIRIIFGDAPLALTETEQGKLLSLFEEYRKLDTRWYKFAENAARAKIAFPNLPLDVSDSDRRSINVEIHTYAYGADEAAITSKAPTFAYLTACLTIVGRNNIDMTSNLWNNMRVAFRAAQRRLSHDSSKRLSDRYNGSDGAKEAESFSRFAASLKIIAAARVEVTDKGLEIVDRKIERPSGIEIDPATLEFISSEKQELMALERTGLYVFHGSGRDLDKLEPRQAIDSQTGPDGPPAVFASNAAEYAIFMAVVAPLGQTSSGATVSNDAPPVFHFEASKETLDRLTDDSFGFVYVFNKDEFEPHKGAGIEFKSLQEVHPLKKIRVSKRDLPKNIGVIPE